MQTVKFDCNTNKLHLSKILKPSKLDGGEFELHIHRFERHTQPCDDQILSADQPHNFSFNLRSRRNCNIPNRWHSWRLNHEVGQICSSTAASVPNSGQMKWGKPQETCVDTIGLLKKMYMNLLLQATRETQLAGDYWCEAMLEENPNLLGILACIMETPSGSTPFVILCCWYHFVLSVPTSTRSPASVCRWSNDKQPTLT